MAVGYYSRLLTITAAASSSIKTINAGLFDRPLYTDTDGGLRQQSSTKPITSEDVPLNLPDIDEPSTTTDNNDNNNDSDEPGVIISSSPLIAIEEQQDDTNAAAIATPTICKSFSECQTAASSLNIPLYTSEHLQLHTKGCYTKNNNAFWSSGTIDEISSTDLPTLQSRLYCNNYSSQTISVVNSFPQLVMPTWTAIQYWNAESEELATPIYNTAITLTFDIFNDIKGETGCNSYFGRYKELSSTSFVIDGAIGQTLIGCEGALAEQESTYLNNWMSSNTTLIKWRIKPNDNTLELKNGKTNQLIGIYKTVCMTEEQCDESAQKLNIPVGYSNDSFPTKGCFTKNNVAYWSTGNTLGSMAEVELPGVQERIYCPVDTSSSSGDILDSGGKEEVVTTTNSPVASPKVSVSVFDIDKIKDEGEEEKQEDSALKSSGVGMTMNSMVVLTMLGMAVLTPLMF